jgi:DNA-binding FadR family transcriptional regulator
MVGEDGDEARPPSQTDVVIQGIKDMILDGRLRAEDRLPVEKDLAALLDVSRGSLREGVRALVMLGVLETRQGDGTYVTSLDPERLLSPLGLLADLQRPANAVHLLGVRRVLEGEAAALAAARIDAETLSALEVILDRTEQLAGDGNGNLEAFIDADSEFHRRIADASGNPALAGLVSTIVGRTFRTRLWRAISDRGVVQSTHDEHRAILAELSRHDSDRARLRMTLHILGVEEYVSDHAPESAD